MKDLTIPGLLPGIACPSCRRGLLIVVCHKDKGSNGIYGPGGRSWNRDIIERLACTHCSISYETSMRGQDLGEHLNKQVEKRLHPAQIRPKDKRCDAHPSIPLKESSYDDYPDRGSLRRSEITHLRNYKYCQACLKVCWIGKSEDEKNAKEFAKTADPALKKAAEDLTVRHLRVIDRPKRTKT